MKKKSKVQRKIKIKTHCYKTENSPLKVGESQDSLRTLPIYESPLKDKTINCQEDIVEVPKKIKLKKIQF